MSTNGNNSNSFLQNPNFWGGTAIAFGAEAYGVIRELGIAALGNVPQARLAKALFEINGALISVGLGAAGGGIAGSPVNGISSSALGIAVTALAASTIAPGVPAIFLGMAAATAFDIVLTDNGIDLANIFDPNTVEGQKVQDFSQAIQDLLSGSWNTATNSISELIDQMNDWAQSLQDISLRDVFNAALQALGQWLLDVGEDFLSDLWDLLDPFNTDQRIPDWLRDLFDNPPISPLVLDLDEDGIDLVTLDASSAYFDLDIDGFAEKTAWIAADDAFLAYDRNGNGVIDDRSELFGGETEDGFTALAREDSNGDGIIDAADPVFASLLLWRDADGDGVTDPGELQSLADAGIVSIDLDAAFIDRWIGGNWFSHESTYTLVDGTSASVVDVWFENDQLLTLYTGGGAATLDPAAVRLPDLAGYGTVPDLSIALSQQPALAQAIGVPRVRSLRSERRRVDRARRRDSLHLGGPRTPSWEWRGHRYCQSPEGGLRVAGAGRVR